MRTDGTPSGSPAARTIGSRQRAFAQSALGKYLPADVAAQIMRDPDQLSLHGERRNIFCVFTDLEGFTKMSHALEPEMVAKLLNRYLEMLSQVVLDALHHLHTKLLVSQFTAAEL